MKKIISPCPVSQKAYANFIGRISTVFTDPHIRVRIIAALDRYLEGDRLYYTRELAPEYVMAFEMLRFDIDLAISRSEKARERARRRRKARMAQAEDVVTDMPDAEAIHVAAGGGALATDDAPQDMLPSEPPAQDVEDMGESLRKYAGQYWAEREARMNSVPVIMTRRQRRAEQRMARTKTRWRKL